MAKILRKTRDKLNARRNAYARMTSEEQKAERAPGSMKKRS